MSRKKLRTTHPLLRQDIDMADLQQILARARSVLSEDDVDKLAGAVDTLGILTAELERKGASVERLRRMLFGSATEKTERVLGPQPSTDAASKTGASSNESPKAPALGHGRNGASAYEGARKQRLTHPSLTTGAACPHCPNGKVYPLKEPATLVRITGMAPLNATVFECDRLRCGLCGEVFTAPTPEPVGDEKYDASARAMVGLLKYGAGLPFNRIEKLQASMGIPMPAATQWELVEKSAREVEPVVDELVRQAAQGTVVHNDDTTMKVLSLPRPEDEDGRTGTFTSGIVSTVDGHHVALFFTGPKHAGENLEEVLGYRLARLPPPIQMSDGLAQNTAGDFKSIVANCLVHARRNFVDIVDHFPDECSQVLETLKEVYKNEKTIRDQGLSDDERLTFHQRHSAERMEQLKCWIVQQLDEKRVEPNSSLGEAFKYMLKRWEKLTLFLHVAGAPLDNNICERALKKAILHRKNALFYKTLNGARVGDCFMTLIHTAELCGVDAFQYLTALQRHCDEVALNPAAWLPWTWAARHASPGRVQPAAAAPR